MGRYTKTLVVELMQPLYGSINRREVGAGFSAENQRKGGGGVRAQPANVGGSGGMPPQENFEF